MARRADPTPGHQRLLGLAAVAGLAVATALAFGRGFAGRAPTLQLVAAALASVAIAALFERRGLLLATLASLAGLAFAIVVGLTLGIMAAKASAMPASLSFEYSRPHRRPCALFWRFAWRPR